MLSRPELHGTYGAVSTTHWLASAAGMAMFDRGGNAFDAAVAAAFVIQVVEPHVNGPAAEAPVMIHDASTGEVTVVAGQGPMPRRASVDTFRRLGLNHIPGSGLLAACVPGAFGAWMKVLQHHGRLRLAEVLEPAIGYAERGFPLLPKAAGIIDVLAPLFREEWTETGKIYLDRGVAPRAGALLRNPDLAATFRRIVREAGAAGRDRELEIQAAVDVFYEGFVAEAIDAFMGSAEALDATGKRHGGLLRGDDLAAWRPTVEPPVTAGYRGHVVHKPGPWTQGPVFLQQLALLEGFDLAAMPHLGPDHLHLVVEAAKLAFGDREAWYGDPDHVDVPLKELLSADYTLERRALIGEHAAAALRPGSPGGRSPWLPPLPEAPPPLEPAWRDQLAHGIPAVVRRTSQNRDTTCVSATDRDGNMVVATQSGGWFSSSPIVPGLGFALSTRGQMAWLAQGHPNSLAPGKRPRTTLSPTIVQAGSGEPLMAFGTPGGDQQDQWTLNFLINHLDFGMTPQAAVEALTFHTGHVPSSFTPRQQPPPVVVVEEGLSEETVDGLRRRGHRLQQVAAQSLGKVCATGHAGDGQVFAAASARGEQAYGIVR
ncbi:gamma-glutamyltransferase family protein [Couchioplanes caeruleus]|uniref:Gamma-glutamyltransferase n=2 Tax=Couchioplanes caeruleus TaxID=56438 RepID=A0A1K0H1R7_9ACTN|nr:gamma-glutamyltransferase family protein [Couchioplanes caeruleus]OJF15643.1 gamma-glutamyltransferase [Couchioplanes caeruleus subsp. caeruleus]ROP33823.1 gamma-glutamyltranspeptidase/glutathione hydrolase [Couchioplanes caeruleus]